MARFLVGAATPSAPNARIVDTGHRRARDLALEVPPSPLEAVMSDEVWEQVYDRLAELVEAHRTTLVFVNTRRMAERVARHLSERLGEEQVAAHHGSLAKEQRLDAEQRLKRGELKALVATASLELGIDIGDVDLVCQIGSPRSIATLPAARRPLRPRGRRHAQGAAVPAVARRAGRMRGAARRVRRGELDRADAFPSSRSTCWRSRSSPRSPRREWSEDALFALLRRAWPYRDLRARGFRRGRRRCWPRASRTRRGRRGALIHHDAVNGMLRGRRGARLTALTSGGAIPDTADYQVLLEPEDQVIGTVNEDFAVESLAGDIFQLGNTSYRILRVERGTRARRGRAGAAAEHPVLARRGARPQRRAVRSRCRACARAVAQRAAGRRARARRRCAG